MRSSTPSAAMACRSGSSAWPARGPAGSACIVSPDGERSFVADRGAALQLRPEDLRAQWFTRADGLHLPIYSLLGEPLGAGRPAGHELARESGAFVSIDLASIGPLLERGRPRGRGPHRGGRARTCSSRPPRRPRRCSAPTWSTACSTSRRSSSSSAARRAPPSSPETATSEPPLRSRDRTPHRHRHDRRRRRLRRRLPRRLVRRPLRRPIPPSRAPTSRRHGPPSGRAPAVDAAARIAARVVDVNQSTVDLVVPVAVEVTTQLPGYELPPIGGIVVAILVIIAIIVVDRRLRR